MSIEGFNPILSKIVNEAWKNDPLHNDKPFQIIRQSQEPFNLTCVRGENVLVSTFQLASPTIPDQPMINVGVIPLGDKPTIVFSDADKTGQRDIAVLTLQTACQQIECSRNGCNLLRQKYTSRDARKRTKK